MKSEGAPTEREDRSTIGRDRWEPGERREQTVMRYGFASVGVSNVVAISVATSDWSGISSSPVSTPGIRSRVR